MNKVLYIILISFFSLIVFSCAEDDKKTEAPVLTEVYPVITPTSDPSPNYTFSSTKAGTISYGGSCSSGTTSATSGRNTITFLTLSDGTYSDCTLIVTDSDETASNTLAVTTFVVATTSTDTTGPTVSSISPTDNQSGVSTSANISVTFSEAMDKTPYKYIEELLSWENANNYCVEQGGHLPALNSAEEHSMLSELCFSNSGNEDCWIGLNDIDLEDDFQWANGTAYPTDGYTFNWTWNRADRDCFVLEGYYHNGSIEGDFCNSAKNFLCEIPPTVTTNTDNTSCYGTLRVSSDNFSSCVQMSSSPSSSNSDMTFTLDPSYNLTHGTNYKTRVTTLVKDSAGNALNSQYETSSGFTTSSSSVETFVAVGASGTIIRSSDNGSSFDNATSPTGNWLVGVTSGNNSFVGVGQSGNMVRSSDNGASWDNATSPLSVTLRSIFFGNNTFVGVGDNGNIVRSTDNGVSWDNATSPTGNRLWGVTFGNNTFVAVGNSGNIVRSTDNGSSFDNATSPITSSLYGVTFGNNTFVGVGDNGSIVRSTDNGTTWDNATSPTANNLWGITFGNNAFVGVGDNGNVVRSTDNGSSFDNATSPTSNHLVEVTYGNNTFVGVGYSGSILRSTDNGSSWNNVTSPTTKNLYGVTAVLPIGFCYSDPNNSQWYLAKTADESGWSSGDSCYTSSGSITPYGGQSCVGGSGLTSCISACETAGINCNSK